MLFSSFTGIYILDIVPGIVAAGIKLIWIFKFNRGKATPDTDKAVKVSATAIVK